MFPLGHIQDSCTDFSCTPLGKSWTEILTACKGLNRIPGIQSLQYQSDVSTVYTAGPTVFLASAEMREGSELWSES